MGHSAFLVGSNLDNFPAQSLASWTDVTGRGDGTLQRLRRREAAETRPYDCDLPEQPNPPHRIKRRDQRAFRRCTYLVERLGQAQEAWEAGVGRQDDSHLKRPRFTPVERPCKRHGTED